MPAVLYTPEKGREEETRAENEQSTEKTLGGPALRPAL
jgi:hypothetical protein